MGVSINIEDHSRELLETLHDKIPVALEECGLAAEGYAKRLCAVDTGLLRNSITHAISGQPPAISQYSDNSGIQHGEYSGSAPSDGGEHEMSMYLGTNVEYAPYVEMGTSRTMAQPFIEPAISNNKDKYIKILESELRL